MAASWFEQKGMTEREANQLESDYRKRGRRTEKTFDPVACHWVVRVYLQEYKYLPRSQIAAYGFWG